MLSCYQIALVVKHIASFNQACVHCITNFSVDDFLLRKIVHISTVPKVIWCNTLISSFYKLWIKSIEMFFNYRIFLNVNRRKILILETIVYIYQP